MIQDSKYIRGFYPGRQGAPLIDSVVRKILIF